MRAMVVTEFGPPEVLQPRDIPQPTPRPHDLLIEVHAVATNPVDFKIRKGAFREGRRLPFALGYDVSGVVRDTGPLAEGFQIGDEVYANPSLVRDGADAEHVCVDARLVARKPGTLDHVHAAALPLCVLTAWEALYEKADLQTGETVLIQAGGGGVGHLAIQLARLRGCRVLTTAGRKDSIELCRFLGADAVIDYTKEDFVDRVKAETEGRMCQVVFDCVGGEVFDRSVRCLAPNGRMVTIVGAHSAEPLRQLFIANAALHFQFVGATALYGINMEKHGRILSTVAWLVESGRLRVHVSRVFELEELAEAHRLQETGHVTGKLVLRVR